MAAASCSAAGGSAGVSGTDDDQVGGAGESPSRAEPNAASERSATGNAPTAQVLRFSAPRLGGGTVEGEDYSGSDVAFWFWAPW